MRMTTLHISKIEVISSVSNLKKEFNWLLVLTIGKCIYVQKPTDYRCNPQLFNYFPSETLQRILSKFQMTARQANKR